MTEEDVLGQIRAFLEFNGARVFRVIERVPKCYRCGLWLGSSERGHADLEGWWPIKTLNQRLDFGDGKPIHFFIEVKKLGGKRRPAQEAWIRQAQEDGVIAFFADSVEETIKRFKDYGIVL